MKILSCIFLLEYENPVRIPFRYFFLQQFSKRGKREIFMLSLGRVRNESFNFYLGLKNSVIKLSCVYLFKSLFYLKKFCLNEDKISTLICIFREVVIIF